MIKNALGWLSDEPHQLIGIRILQVAIGSMILFRVFTELPFASYLWGPNGIGDGSTIPLFGLPGVVLDLAFASEAGVRVVLFLLAASAFGLVFGVLTRLATIVAWVTFMMLTMRLSSLGDGGDNIVQVVLIYMMFLIPAGKTRPGGSLAVWFHNVAVIAIGTQLAVLYLTSGFLKMGGEVWQNGTALYLISQVEWFSLPSMRWILKNPYVVVPATYATMFFQVWFPIAIFSRLKLPWIMLGICFHLGIATFMGLLTFSAVMIGMELFLITDEEHAWLRGKARDLRDFVKSKLTPRAVPEPQLALFIDGFCPKCQRTAALLRKLDARRALRISSFRHSDEYSAHGITADALERRMHAVSLRTGEVTQGFAAVRAVASQVPYLCPARPFLALLGLTGVGERLYDALAARRVIVPDPALCGAGCDVALGGPVAVKTVREV